MMQCNNMTMTHNVMLRYVDSLAKGQPGCQDIVTVQLLLEVQAIQVVDVPGKAIHLATDLHSTSVIEAGNKQAAAAYCGYSVGTTQQHKIQPSMYNGEIKYIYMLLYMVYYICTYVYGSRYVGVC